MKRLLAILKGKDVLFFLGVCFILAACKLADSHHPSAAACSGVGGGLLWGNAFTRLIRGGWDA